MKLLITIACLIAVTGSCFAQSDLVFFDASGSRAGSLVQFVEDGICNYDPVHTPNNTCNVILSQETLLIRANLLSGAIRITNFWYQSDDCTGQPYLLASLAGPRGGMLLSKGDPTNPVLVEAEWYPNYTTVSLKSVHGYNGICGSSIKNELAMIANIVDPEKYGMKVIPFNGFKAIGFQGPLTPVNERPDERPDGIFCNSFENCPTE